MCHCASVTCNELHKNVFLLSLHYIKKKTCSLHWRWLSSLNRCQHFVFPLFKEKLLNFITIEEDQYFLLFCNFQIDMCNVVFSLIQCPQKHGQRANIVQCTARAVCPGWWGQEAARWRITCLHMLTWTKTCSRLNPGCLSGHNKILMLTQNWIAVRVCMCVCNPRGCCRLLLKLEHQTWAAAHETFTLDHRACKKHVSFNLAPMLAWLWVPADTLHPRTYRSNH